MTVELEALDHVGLVVADIPRSVRWYQEVLGLRRAHEEAWGDFPAVLEANGSGVALFPNRTFRNLAEVSVPAPGRSPASCSSPQGNLRGCYCSAGTAAGGR
jgi:catechol 2,3-dioxygenase-like lactoylglutathione lyase family enzyme